MARHEEWTRGEPSTDNNHAGYYELHYHQTRLARIRFVKFDDSKKSMVAPNWKPRKAGRLRLAALITLFRNFTPLATEGTIPRTFYKRQGKS